jgi:hypothetical protein
MNWPEIKAILRMGIPLLYKEEDGRVYWAEYMDHKEGFLRGPHLRIYGTDAFGKTYPLRNEGWDTVDQRLKSYRFYHVPVS